MKRMLFAAIFAAALLATPMGVGAHEYDRDDSDYPLRYVAYVLHPFGIAVEYALLRPLPWVVSRPNLDIIFGHEPTASENPNYFEWK